VVKEYWFQGQYSNNPNSGFRLYLSKSFDVFFLIIID